MADILMPKATALWLIDNTTLTFNQIADFCGLHLLEVQNLADDEQTKIAALNPLTSGQLTKEEITRCEADEKASLELLPAKTPDTILGKKKTKYTPLSKRRDRPDAIAWLLKFHPDLDDKAIVQLLGTTKGTIEAVRNKTHWNADNIKARNPVQLGLCKQEELDTAIQALSV